MKLRTIAVTINIEKGKVNDMDYRIKPVDDFNSLQDENNNKIHTEKLTVNDQDVEILDLDSFVTDITGFDVTKKELLSVKNYNLENENYNNINSNS